MREKEKSFTAPIQVCVRVRPPRDQNTPFCCTADEDSNTLVIHNDGQSGNHGSGGAALPFSRVFGPESSTADLFHGCVLPSVEKFLSGVSAGVMAYGRTGAGKTHTMIGPEGGLGKGGEPGVLLLAAKAIFSRINDRVSADGSANTDYRVTANYCEIYQNSVRDLLRDTDVVGQRSRSTRAVGLARAGQAPLTTARVLSPDSVLSLISAGSSRRATASTGLNATSSRSHAVLSLHLARRERDPSTRRLGYTEAVSTLTLADLAGSEAITKSGATGERLAEAASINTGLLALHRVIDALCDANAGSGGRRHVPYRDSALTSILSQSLGGDTLSTIVLCVCPDGSSAAGTVEGAQWATRAMRIVQRVSVTKRKVEEDRDAGLFVENDITDVDEALNAGRGARWITLSGGGRVFARVAGTPGAPLVLLVHGSGPRNSSIWWNNFTYQFLVLTHLTMPVFIVAIDCPGYGRSEGDRSEIRSNPRALFSSVSRALGYERALLTVGSSQGAAAVLASAVEDSGGQGGGFGADFVAVMDPVTYNVGRFPEIKCPVYMAYDLDDPGHPASAGRVAARRVTECVHVEYSSAREPYWLDDNFARGVVAMINDRPHVVSGHRSGYSNSVSDATGDDPGGGLLTWALPHDREFPPKAYAMGLLAAPHPGYEIYRSGYGELGRGIFNQQRDSNNTSNDSDQNNVQLFSDDDESDGCCSDSGAFKDRSDPSDPLCDSCRLPIEISGARSCPICIAFVCVPCVEWCVTGSGECPVCLTSGLPVQRWESVDTDAVFNSGYGGGNGPESDRDEHKDQHQRGLNDDNISPENSNEDDAAAAGDRRKAIPGYDSLCDRQAERVLEIERVLGKGRAHLVVEFGNIAVPTSNDGRHRVTCFAKCVRVKGGGSSSANGAIASVSFNINPRYPKSAIRVTGSGPGSSSSSIDGKRVGQFFIEREMSTLFPCNMTIEWQASLGAPPLHIVYRVVHEGGGCARRIRVMMPDASAAAKKKKKRAAVEYAWWGGIEGESGPGRISLVDLGE